MEEKKLDLNSIIGFVLISGILIWMLYSNAPTPEEQKEKEKKEQLDKFQQALFNLIPSTHRVFQKLKERTLEERERATEQGVLHVDTG